MTSAVYLDWNATTPPLPAALEVMAEVARSAWGNPASLHSNGRTARDVVETAREAIATLVGASPRDVIFTSGGTEANNLALHDAPALVTSQLEHPSVTRVADALAAAGRPVVWLPVPPSGRLEPAAVKEALKALPTASGAVVCVAAANHETGVIQAISEIAELTHLCGARLHVDAVQAVGKLPNEAFADADSLSLAAHKLRGPKGIGALIHRPDRAPKPLLLGGGQERGRRPGTVDPVAAAGFRVAAEWARSSLAQRPALGRLRDRLEEELLRTAAAQLNGEGAARLCHCLLYTSDAADE